jgi:hypothetical protein
MKKISLFVAVAAVIALTVNCSTYECEISLPGESWVENTHRIPKFEKEFHVKAPKEGAAAHSAAAGLIVENASAFGGGADSVVADLKKSFQRSSLYKGASIRCAGEKELNGVKWTVMELGFTVRDVTMHQDFYLTKKGNQVFTILYSATGDDNYRQYLPDFIAMVTKAKFTGK